MKTPLGTLILVCLCMLANAEVSYDSLKGFWETTYDADKDGTANIDDLIAYFNLMEPEHGINAADCQPIFDFFDANSDKLITLEELINLAKIKVTHDSGHKQLHLGLTGKQAEMQVIWVSNPEHYNQPIVEYGRIPGMLKNIANGTFHTYDVGKIGGFKGRIYVATMKSLDPLKRYYYRVGDRQTRTFSNIKYFTSPPLKNQELEEMNIAVFGDMGTFAPFGAFVIDKIAKDNLITPFSLVFLTGDIAYAGVNSQSRGQSAPIWDLFGQLTQKFAAYTAFMPGVGNHQSYYNYTAYFNRYILPRSFPHQTNLYFSFDYGQVHFVHFSSEHPYNNGSQQYNFLENDLREARNNPTIQWIIVGAHRTFYSSNLDGYNERRDLAVHLQDLMYQYKVDIVQTGHLHNYERTYPVYKGKAVMRGVNHTHYVDPEAPVYMTQGTAGALIKEKFLKPAPQWAVCRQDKYGYGRISIKGKQLKYQFITIPSGRIADQFTIVKTAKETIQQER